MDLSDDFRDGFVDLLRIDAPEDTRFAAARAERSAGNFTIFQNGVYTACEACKDDPQKPPKWQVKAMRIIHDQNEKMMYFEDAKLEFLGVPRRLFSVLLGARPDREAQDRRAGADLQHQLGLRRRGHGPVLLGAGTGLRRDLHADDHDQAGPVAARRVAPAADQRRLLHSRDRPLSARQECLPTTTTPAYREWRGSLESSGQFNLSDKWVWGWDGTLLTDKTYFQDYGLLKGIQGGNLLRSTPDYALSQVYLAGRGDRSYFDARAMYFYGFSLADDQKQIPVVQPVIDHDYVFKYPIFGGELGFRNNLTSLSRDTANFDPIYAGRHQRQPLRADHRRSRRQDHGQLPAARRTRQLHPVLHRMRRGDAPSSIRSGQMFTPFVIMRADVADMNIVRSSSAVSNYINVGANRHRARHADGRPRIPLPAHQRAVLGHADDRADRPADLAPQ